MTLTLTPEKESRLAEQARAAGLSLVDYVQRVVDQAAGGDTPAAATLSQLLEGRIGTVASGDGDLSQDTAGWPEPQ
jgi:hypothetical protein